MELRGLHLHFDCPSGAAGDMALGALFDLGVPESAVRDVLARLPVHGYRLNVVKAMRGGMAGTDVTVAIEHHHHDPEDHDHHHDDHEHAHTHWHDIRAMIERHTDGAVRALALKIFELIATVEAKLHGVSIDEVAFHEVGAVDSIVDVVGTAAAIAWLAPTSVSSSVVATGQGTIKTAHGILPVPVPAVVEIFRARGVPSVPGGSPKELCTPTGAAILAALATSFGDAPPMTPVAIGYGAGDRDLPDRPNLLRASVGRLTDAKPSEDELVQLEANLDDMSPELCEHVADRLFAAGALDVWWTPVVMKKSRPAFVLGVLAPRAALDGLAGIVLAETTSLGVRWSPVARRVLSRRSVTVETPYGPIPVKLGLDGDRIVNAAPEYEACRAAASSRGVPLKEVYAAAIAAHRRG
jgi:uncharacterized protein (TIGR00299 family) protein